MRLAFLCITFGLDFLQWRLKGSLQHLEKSLVRPCLASNVSLIGTFSHDGPGAEGPWNGVSGNLSLLPWLLNRTASQLRLRPVGCLLLCRSSISNPRGQEQAAIRMGGRRMAGLGAQVQTSISILITKSIFSKTGGEGREQRGRW